jgi:colicin import membrane protein
MNPQSPGAYALSALIHGAVAAVILFFSYAASSVVKETPRIFELVAGAGDNYAATVAPALGGQGRVRPSQAAPKPAPSPIQSAPETVQSPAKPAKPPDLVTELKRAEIRRELNLERKYQKEQEAEKKRISQEEFQKQQAAAKAATTKVSHIDAEGIKEGVIGGSQENKTGGAGGKALTREEGSEMEAYFSLLTSRIKENLAPPEGLTEDISARVEFYLAADGSRSGARITKSSGNAEFDRAVIEACERTRSIGPRPDGRSELVQMTFHLRDEQAP